MSRHRVTDPACSEYRPPTGPFTQLAHDAARGKLCVECALNRQRQIMHANLRAAITEQVIGTVMAVLRDELDKASWDLSPASLTGLHAAIRRVGHMQHPDSTGGTITPQTMQEP